jgi:hypothetical protein
MSKSIVICVMDRNGFSENTDIIIIIDSIKKTIQWIPRDLFSKRVNFRINVAYTRTGPEGLKKCLKDIHINVDECVCMLPLFIEEAIKIIDNINVPVKISEKFYYPLHRHKPIEEGKKIISFNIPSEILSGDRFHEWLGARSIIKEDGKNNYNYYNYPDFIRVSRQQILLKEIIKKKFNFTSIINSPNCRGINKNVINILNKIDNTWKIIPLMKENYIPINKHGYDVLQAKNNKIL